MGADDREQTITYVNDSDEPDFDGASATRLGQGYAMDTNRPHTTYGHYFDDHAAARAAYTAERAGI